MSLGDFEVDTDGQIEMEKIIQSFFEQEGDRAKSAAEKICDAIAAGRIEIEFQEAFDSCSKCGGYHGVISGCVDWEDG